MYKPPGFSWWRDRIRRAVPWPQKLESTLSKAPDCEDAKTSTMEAPPVAPYDGFGVGVIASCPNLAACELVPIRTHYDGDLRGWGR